MFFILIKRKKKKKFSYVCEFSGYDYTYTKLITFHLSPK